MCYCRFDENTGKHFVLQEYKTKVEQIEQQIRRDRSLEAADNPAEKIRLTGVSPNGQPPLQHNLRVTGKMNYR